MREKMLKYAILSALLLRQAAAQTPGLPSAAVIPAVGRPARVYLTLRLDGLYPKATTVTEGPVEVVLSNPTFLTTFDVAIVDGLGAALSKSAAAALAGIRSRNLAKATVLPGKYTLMVVGHPEWTTALTVTARAK